MRMMDCCVQSFVALFCCFCVFALLHELLSSASLALTVSEDDEGDDKKTTLAVVVAR